MNPLEDSNILGVAGKTGEEVLKKLPLVMVTEKEESLSFLMNSVLVLNHSSRRVCPDQISITEQNCQGNE